MSPYGPTEYPAIAHNYQIVIAYMPLGMACSCIPLASHRLTGAEHLPRAVTRTRGSEALAAWLLSVALPTAFVMGQMTQVSQIGQNFVPHWQIGHLARR